MRTIKNDNSVKIRKKGRRGPSAQIKHDFYNKRNFMSLYTEFPVCLVPVSPLHNVFLV